MNQICFENTVFTLVRTPRTFIQVAKLYGQIYERLLYFIHDINRVMRLILSQIWWFLKEPFCVCGFKTVLLATGIFRHGFRSLADSVFSQFSGQEQTNGSLDFPRRNSRLLVVMSELGSFAGNSLEDIIDEGVHDTHSFAGNTSVWVNLLQNFVDVDRIAFFTFRSSFLVSTNSRFLAGLLSTF